MDKVQKTAFTDYEGFMYFCVLNMSKNIDLNKEIVKKIS
jgi:hypothetical protein